MQNPLPSIFPAKRAAVSKAKTTLGKQNKILQRKGFIGFLQSFVFETQKVKRMYDISELFPTKVSRLLGINSDRYSVKLSNPEKFTVAEILKLAYILSINPILIFDVIQKEAEKRISDKIKLNASKYKLS